MKIGILAAMYNCAKDVDAVLAPFKSDVFVTSACNIQFDKFDIPPDKDTLIKLYETPEVEYIATSVVPLPESDARDIALRYLLSRDVDYVWLVDGDEFYTDKEVKAIQEVLLATSHGPYFSINFKNYVFDGRTWVAGFCPPRIFSNRIHGGIKSFYWDNDICYNDGTDYKSIPHVKIPESAAHVRHMTWLHSNGKEKVSYQLKHFGECSYLWNSLLGELEFNESFYLKHKLKKPELRYD